MAKFAGNLLNHKFWISSTITLKGIIYTIDIHFTILQWESIWQNELDELSIWMNAGKNIALWLICLILFLVVHMLRLRLLRCKGRFCWCWCWCQYVLYSSIRNQFPLVFFILQHLLKEAQGEIYPWPFESNAKWSGIKDTHPQSISLLFSPLLSSALYYYY